MHRRDLDRIAVECLIALEAVGVSVEIVSDFEGVPDVLAKFDAVLGPANNPERLLMTAGNSFWVFAHRAGEPIAAFGVRVDDLGDEDAQAFLPKSIQVIFGVKVTGQLSDIYVGKRWGRAAYFGSFVSRTARGLSRDGRRIIQLLTAYVHHCAFRDLSADVNYCFLRGVDGSRGLSYGFMNADPFVWTTDRPMYKDGNPEWVMQLPRSRMPALMTSMSILMRHGFTEDQKSLYAVKVDHAAG